MMVRRTQLGTSAGIALAIVIAIAGCTSDETSPFFHSQPEDDAAVDATASDAGGEDGVDTDAGADAAATADVDADAPPVVEPDDRSDGAACVDDIQCASGFCMRDDAGFPGGFCTVADCTTRRDCFGAGRACLRGEFNGNLCVELCSEDADCRGGYECVGSATGSYCYPAFANAVLEPTCSSELIAEDDVGSVFGGRMNRHRITFDLEEGTTSFSVIAWDRRFEVLPVTMRLPSGDTFDLTDYGNYLFTPVTLRHVSPMLFPGGPQFRELVMPGRYEMDVGFQGGEDDDLCFVVIEEADDLDPDGPLLEVDMNFYFVGVPGLSSRTADRDRDFREMLFYFDEVFEPIGLALGDVRYYDVTGDVEEEFTIIRDADAVSDLVTLSRQPGSGRDALLSANVFFIQGFAGRQASTLGVSTGIPGAPAIHGRLGTGLVFSAEQLGNERFNGNRLVGQVLAHELGHFLGLFHTTERQGGGVDHLDDTPVCDDFADGDLQSCPDFSNLMFPIAAVREEMELSDGQAIIVRANPLTKLPSLE